VVVQSLMRDEGLEDVTANRVFFDVSEISTVCDEIDIHVVRARGLARITVYNSQIFVEKFLKNPRTKAASKSGAVRGKDRVRLYIADQTRNQAGGWVDEIAVRRTRRSVVVDRVEDQVVGDLGMGLCNLKPKAKKCERLFVMLVG